MEQIFYIVLAPFVILAFWLWRTNQKLEKTNDYISRMKKDLDLAHNEKELIYGKLKQLGTAGLDLAVIENQAEENMQQLTDYVQQEVSRLDSDINNLQEEMEEAMEGLEERVSELEVAEEEDEDGDEDDSNGEEIIRKR